MILLLETEREKGGMAKDSQSEINISTSGQFDSVRADVREVDR